MSHGAQSFWQWDGARYSPAAAVPLVDRGFRYGMSVFESIRVAGGQADFLAEHCESLRRACETLRFPVPTGVLEALGPVLSGTEGDVFARIYVTAGDGPPQAPVLDPRVFVLLEERPRPSAKAYRIGLCTQGASVLFGGLKTGNYWRNLEQWTQAQGRGEDEALLFNEGEELVSGCVANVFLVIDGRIATPAISCGARAGVLRHWVLGRCEVEERVLKLSDVERAEEVFLTNSWIGVMPVTALAGRTLACRDVASRLQSELGGR